MSKRGRSALPENIRKSNTISIRMSPNELEVVEYAAQQAGITRAVFIQTAAVKAARR